MKKHSYLFLLLFFLVLVLLGFLLAINYVEEQEALEIQKNKELRQLAKLDTISEVSKVQELPPHEFYGVSVDSINYTYRFYQNHDASINVTLSFTNIGNLMFKNMTTKVIMKNANGLYTYDQWEKSSDFLRPNRGRFYQTDNMEIEKKKDFKVVVEIFEDNQKIFEHEGKLHTWPWEGYKSWQRPDK